MNCNEAHEYLFAFLDNELDAHLSIEVQRHLDHCPHCAQQAEIEREVHKKLTQVLKTDLAAQPLNATALGEFLAHNRPVPGRSRIGFLRRRAWLAGAAAVAAIATVAYWPGENTAPAVDAIGDLADLVVQDYVHFVQEGGHLQLASADASMVAGWLRDKTGLQVSFANRPGHPCKLLGARKCKLAGQPAAFALFDMQGTAVSLVATERRHVQLGRMSRRAGTGERGAQLWVDRCQGHSVVAVERGALVYAAVSTIGQQELIHFIESTVHASD